MQGMHAQLMGGRSAQVRCNGIQGIYGLIGWGLDLPGRSAKYEICQVWCNGIQGIYARLMGSTSASRSGVDAPNLSFPDV